MKNTLILSFFLALLILLGCSDNDKGPYVCDSCVDAPEALAANNNSGKGIYKGIVLGSTGTIKFNIANNGNTISGVLVLDGETYELHPWPEKDVVFNNGFSGILAGSRFVDNDLLIEFTVNATGTSFKAESVTIPAHSDVVIDIRKEKSTQLVEIFEGTYSGQSSGTFNLIVLRNDAGNGEWFAVSRDSDGFAEFLNGGIQNKNLNGGTNEIDVKGMIDGDNVSGDWANTAEETSGKWTGKRTL